jgi:hypothetical protein
MTGRPAVVLPDTLHELLRARIEVDATEQYGYGIRTRGTGIDLALFHAGLLPGFASYDEVRPGERLSVTVLSNLDTADAAAIGRNLASMARV